MLARAGYVRPFGGFTYYAAAIAALVIAPGGVDRAAAANPKPKPLDRAAITQLVVKHLKADPSYMPGDLLTQRNVEPIFNELIEQGRAPADNEALYDSILSDRDPLAVALRTPEGLKFMRAVSRMPSAYDRLERLSWSPIGRKMLAELIAVPEGPKLFERILTPEGAARVEEVLKNDPRGGNFQLPTGRIHTANEFIEQLEAKLGKK